MNADIKSGLPHFKWSSI